MRIRLETGLEVDVWSAHLDCAPYGPYEARFDGLAEAELITHEGGRLARMREILRWIADSVVADSAPVVLVGDFNTPSHLDWPGVEWPVTKAAEEAGLCDSYRDGSGRPEPQDRIDFVLYRGRGLRVLDSRAVVSGAAARPILGSSAPRPPLSA